MCVGEKRIEYMKQHDLQIKGTAWWVNAFLDKKNDIVNKLQATHK